MLYIFDLGNVIIDIDFNRVLGTWSHYTHVPLARVKERFHMGESFQRHERGEISDDVFIQNMSHELCLPLSPEQFTEGWQAVFVGLRPEVIDIMRSLRSQQQRVVVLSNTNLLHTLFWRERWPEVDDAASHVYLSHEIGMRKPEPEIYQYVLSQEGVAASDAVFFDDNHENINAAQQLGITSVLVDDRKRIPAWFAEHNPVT
ncbi:glucose-1-phosphatase [Mangrovibacter phragmitis]|uniref:Glucose-1-phosphatase n=1 Tax=Mangrovibacter phragmitis TaxID=1691903 RepID=A0A1B7L695_9ENTR|nr:glucose-1-phosphatase [Mangrovibacter phragmitis]OAT77882.1 glucose-1-phosphatase [Mangrovibacter phragmitis]